MTKSSTVTIGRKPASALWAGFIAQHSCPTRPSYAEGWRTIRELADETGLARKSIERIMDAEFTAGRVERVQARIGTGNNQRAYFYRPKARG